jgi:hypothetical protein
MTTSMPELPTSVDVDPENAAFIADMRRQTNDRLELEVKAGRLLPAAEMAALLKLTPQALHFALKAKRVFTLQGPSGVQMYPAFFADPRQDRKQLEKVSKMLGDMPGSLKWDFFMSPRFSVGGVSPLEALAKGKFEDVLSVAFAFTTE